MKGTIGEKLSQRTHFEVLYKSIILVHFNLLREDNLSIKDKMAILLYLNVTFINGY